MPAKYPKEFRDDVVRVALNREPGVTLSQIAKDFGIHVGTLDKWLRQARIEDGELLIRSGPMRWRIPVQDIRRIEASRSWLSSPALSLDRLRIHHCRATGRMRQVLVSPRDRQGFVQALQLLNPNIAVQGL